MVTKKKNAKKTKSVKKAPKVSPAKKEKKVKKTIPQEAGVNEFIKKLRKKGIDEGKYRAHEIIKEAEEKAEKLLAKAQKDGDKIISNAEKKSTKLESAAKESIKTAFRDAVLDMENTVQESFVNELKKVIKTKVSDDAIIKEMILKIIETSNSKNVVEILVADPVKDEEEIKSSVYGITKRMLKDGFKLKTFASPDKKGIVIREVKKGLEIDLTDEAISDLLLEYLLPVYRDLLKEDD